MRDAQARDERRAANAMCAVRVFKTHVGVRVMTSVTSRLGRTIRFSAFYKRKNIRLTHR